MFYVEGKVMERRSFTTGKGQKLKIIAMYVKNGKYSNLYEFVDWEDALSGVNIDDFILVPISVSTSVAKSGRAYLNFGIQGEACPASILNRAAE